MSDAERLAEYVRTHPDAHPLEVLGALGLPPEYRDHVEDVLDGDPADAGDGDDVDTAEDGENHPPEAGSPRSNPTPGADASDSGTPDAPADDHAGDGWADADFPVTEPGTYPPALLEREQWMGRRGKLPFAPWGDRDADLECSHTTCPAHAPDDTPEDVVAECPDCRAHREGATTAECDHDARYKWGHAAHYVDGEHVDMVEPDRRLDGRVFIQREADPFAFVDGDDVRDPDTGEVHPAFVRILERLGATYADVSTSGAGVHAYYRGALPGEQGQAVFQIDSDPWGSNDDPPTVEIYANTHVCVATGEHVAGTPADVAPWDADVVAALLEDHGARKDPDPATVDHDTHRDRADLEDHTPSATGADETTDDVRDVLAAVDRLTPRDLPLRSRQVGTDATGWEKWDPSTYRTSSGNDSLHRPPGEPVFHDFKHGESFGVLSLFAAEQGILSRPWDRLAGADWWDAVDAARDRGAPIPEYVGPRDGDADPVAPLALAKLDALADADRERYARKRGLSIPSTDDARARLRDALFRELRAGNRTVLDAPTALGKSHTVATTPWRDYVDVTGGAPVVHLHPTTDARDDAAGATRSASATGAVLKGRKERCPVARGDHDPPEDGEDPERAPDEIVTVDGDPAREWFDRMCDRKGLPFSTAHALAREHNDQGRDALPCCESGDCPAVTQWDGLPRDDDGEPAVDVIHATHPFAYVPSLRQGTNLVLDEQPDFTADLGDERIRRMVTAYLQAVDAPVTTWEAFVTLARADLAGGESDAARERDAVDDALGTDPGREWYVTDPDAHAYAPDLARAIWNALRWEDADANARRSTKVLHDPPRLDADTGDGYAGVWLSVVVDDDNRVRTVRATPDLSQARAVVGLDAHPSMPLWELNAGPEVTRDAVLEPTERALWRRYERGLTVVQVGDATRPRSGDTAREWMNDERVRAVLERLRDHYGEDFATAIAPLQVEPALRRLLADVAGSDAVDAENTMHYGEEKSRNDYAAERVGYLYGCMDPGDGMILDALAELDLAAEPATATTDAGDVVREKGRTFDGADADTARAVLASVRENHVAQAAGRYARDPDDPESGAVVYAHTDALPPGFADLQVPGVEWLATDTQRAIVDALAERPHATARELADAVGCTKEHVRETLARLADRELVTRRSGAGDHGADVYQEDGAGSALVDLGDGIANDPLYDSIRWSLVVSRPGAREDGPPSGTDADGAGSALVDGGDPPPEPGD